MDDNSKDRQDDPANNTMTDAEREARDKATADAIRDRAPRFESHALVEMRTGWNPFVTSSAVLLDLSIQGFKLEFVNPVKIKTNVAMTMYIPLAPFQMLSPAKLKLKVTIKWFEPRQLRAGGVFVNLDDSQRYLIERILIYITQNMNRRFPEIPR